MCIRDRGGADRAPRKLPIFPKRDRASQAFRMIQAILLASPHGPLHNAAPSRACLLYTSDAADERSSVDLGGRRIIKKKNNRDTHGCDTIYKKYKKSQKYDSYTA